MKKYFILIGYTEQFGGSDYRSCELSEIIDADLEVSTLFDICRELLFRHDLDIYETGMEVKQFNLV